MLIKFNLAGKTKNKARHTLEDYKRELIRRVSVFKGWYATYIISTLMRNNEADFAHIHQGFYMANWNVGIGSPDFHVFDQRDWEPQPADGNDFLLKRKYMGEVRTHKTENLASIDGAYLNKDFLDKPLFVTNGVWYGKWLRDGLQYSDIVPSMLTGGVAQEAQMKALHDKSGGDFVNFQDYMREEIRDRKDEVLKAIRREKAGRPPSARHRSMMDD